MAAAAGLLEGIERGGRTTRSGEKEMPMEVAQELKPPFNNYRTGIKRVNRPPAPRGKVEPTYWEGR
jgi:hypothetical protein